MTSGTQQPIRPSPIKDAIRRTRPWEWAALGILLTAILLRAVLVDENSTAGDRIDAGIFTAGAVAFAVSLIVDRKQHPERGVDVSRVVMIGFFLLMAALRLF